VTPPIPDRYARQLVLPEVGEEGQARLAAAAVAIVGCGATGTVIANHLVRAGVGSIRIIDRDWVEGNNLQRQLLFDEKDAREQTPKAAAAERRIREVNGEIRVQGIVEDLNATNVDALLAGCHLVLDGSDNFEVRYLINDWCVREGLPWVYCGAVATYGMTLLIRPGVTPCLRCLFPEPPAPGTAATCDTAGVLGPAVGIIASQASVEALKWLLGHTDALAAGLIHVDAWETTWHVFEITRKSGCPCCERHEFPHLEEAAVSHATALCGRNSVQVTPARTARVDLEAAEERLRPVGPVSRTPHLLKLDLGELQLNLFPDGRAIIQGTDDESVARSLYSRYVGS